jgi:hypothetical protein
MSKNTKIIIAFFILLLIIAALYYYFKDDKTEGGQKITNSTKTGFAAVNLGGILGGLFGGQKVVNADTIGNDPITPPPTETRPPAPDEAP